MKWMLPALVFSAVASASGHGTCVAEVEILAVKKAGAEDGGLPASLVEVKFLSIKPGEGDGMCKPAPLKPQTIELQSAVQVGTTAKLVRSCHHGLGPKGVNLTCSTWTVR